MSTFRDPAGSVLIMDQRVFRLLRPEGVRLIEALTKASSLNPFRASGALIQHHELVPEMLPNEVRAHLEPGGTCIEHPLIPFVSYPSEWTWSMLRDAGLLTLDLARAALEDGLFLKDASPWNILFRAGKPVFVDVLSFCPRPGGCFTWLALDQFLRCFLLPLYLHDSISLSHTTLFRNNRDGLSPDAAFQTLGWFRAMRMPYRRWVALPRALKGLGLTLTPPAMTDGDAMKILRNLFKGLRRDLECCPSPRPTTP